ncbi:hypothetical protein QN277_001267 [Acacia crassicarpa]|uniref:Uncharacterized protein n=1 Tax=Acacia crassicarpa TaxID=499986 RepID=A0AAE1TI52_9FABA|nr:hypothetical protein QN277_001267 [Acacia crassicarpa]
MIQYNYLQLLLPLLRQAKQLPHPQELLIHPKLQKGITKEPQELWLSWPGYSVPLPHFTNTSVWKQKTTATGLRMCSQ